MNYTLTGQPKSTQTIYKYACRGKHPCMYMDKVGKDLKEQYKWEIIAQKAKLLTGELEVGLKLYFKDKRKRDVDNFNKLILDAGTDILWEDDSQIQKLTIEKYIDKINPRIELCIINLKRE